MFKRSFLAAMILAGPAFAQSAGTVVLHGPSFNPALPQVTPEAIAAAVNTAMTSKVDISNGILGGIPTAPTASIGTNTTQVATTAFVLANGGGVSSFQSRTGAISLLSADVVSALGFTPYSSANPSAFQTSGQVSTSVGVETTRATTAEALLAPKASPIFTGAPAVPTASPGTNTTQAASTAFVTAAVVASTAGVASFNTRTGAVTLTSSDVTSALTFTPAPVASPTFTGTTTIPTLVATGATVTTLTATGAITPSQTVGIVGTTTNNSANAGAVGEFINSTVVVGSAITLTSATPANVTSISLTAGDWDVFGGVWFTVGAGGATALHAGINSTSATLPPDPGAGSRASTVAAFGAGTQQVSSLAPARYSLAGTTTIYLVAAQNFPSGAAQAWGDISARRVR